MTAPAPTVQPTRAAIIVSNIFYAIACLILAAWIASWFWPPLRRHTTGTTAMGFVFVILGSSVRRTGFTTAKQRAGGA